MDSRFNKALQSIFVRSGRHPFLVLGLTVAILAGAIWPVSKIKIDADFLGLIPQNNIQARVFKETLTQFGATDMLLVGLSLEGSDDMDASLAYADFLAERLEDSPKVDWMIFNVREFIDAALSLRRFATLLLTEDGLKSYIAKFQPQGLNHAAEELAVSVSSPLEMGMRELLVQDPLNLAPLLAQHSAFRQPGGRTFHPSGYLIDPEERYLLILVKPHGAAADLPFSKGLLEHIETLKAGAETEWREEGYEGDPPEVLLGGGYPIAAAESDLILRDLVGGVAMAGLVIIGLFWFAFGRPSALLISGLPLFAGLWLTFAAITYMVGSLNAATSAFAALLIGLSVDFIIVLFSRYLEERSEEQPHENALRQLGKHTFVSVLIGAITTAATFFAFTISSFRGLSELGVITGVGILISVVTVALLLPALIAILEKSKPVKSGRLRAFGIQRACTTGLAYPRAIAITAALISLALLPFALGVEYDDNMHHMRSLKNPGLVAQNRLMNAFGTRFTPTLIRVTGNGESEVLDRTRKVAESMAPLIEEGEVANIDSLLAMVPSTQKQEKVLERLAALNLDRKAIERQFREGLLEQNLNPDAFMQGLQPYLDALFLTQPLRLKDLTDGPLSPLLSRYYRNDEKGATSLTYVYLPSYEGRLQIPESLNQAVSQTPGAILTGPVVISQTLKSIVWQDARAAMLFGMVLVLLLLGQSLGNARRAIFAALPLIMGLIWTLAIMNLAGLTLNFMNLFVFTMLIGIGIDYGLHMVHRWCEADGDPKALLSTAKAIAIAALTTMVGFGSLVLSHYPGLQSMGWIAILGTSTTALLSISILPALMTLLPQPEASAAMDHRPIPSNPHKAGHLGRKN